jgi:hypothetical protein
MALQSVLNPLGGEYLMAPAFWDSIFLPKGGRFPLLPIFMSTSVFWSRYRSGSRPVHMNLSHEAAEAADYKNHEANDKNN